MVEKWHKKFSPEKFLKRIDIKQLIEANEAFNESKVDALGKPCYICGGLQGPGLLLNDKSYLCKSCFEKVTTITYPERYETLFREYLKESEAWRQARVLLTNKCIFRKTSIFFRSLGYVSLLVIFIGFKYLVIPAFFGVLYFLASLVHHKKIRHWESKYNAPEEPVLKHFHDPEAELSQYDVLVLKIFNNWPGYPPFWRYLRKVVLDRDNHRCQVSGCPSRVEFQIHHKKPGRKGGEHIPSNLITLCDFHHALEPEVGHERIWGKIKYRYFTVVRAHKRRNPKSPGFHYVTAHVRRMELLDESELEELLIFYGLSCPSCKNQLNRFEIDRQKQEVSVFCNDCERSWIGLRRLAEETGPRLAEKLIVTKNEGQWKPNWPMLEKRSQSAFKSIYSKK